MEIGASLAWTERVTHYAGRIDELGFDYLACGEHVAFNVPTPNAFVVLSAAAGVTRRVKLLSSVTLIALYPPALVAKMAAMLDSISDGRFNLGVGVGGEYPKEFEACGVPTRERSARTDEGLEIVDRLLREESASYEGKFYRFADVTISPPPVQRPRPPFWIAGRREAAMRRAARYGDYWMPYMYTPDQLSNSIERIGEFAGEFGRTDPVKPSVFTFVTMFSDDSKARRVAADIVGNTYKQDFSELVDRYLVAGSPAACRRRLEEFRDAGAEAVMLRLACEEVDIEPMLEAISEELVPALR